jgi:hypothetical protein
MRSSVRLRRSIALAGILASAPAGSLGAQSLWPRRLEGAAELGLEWVRPTFDGGDDHTFTRGIWILDGRVRAGKRLNVVAAFPRLVASTGAGGSSSAGNFYMGLEFTDTAGRPEFSLGLRTGRQFSYDDGSEEMGFADFDRLEGVISGVLAISGTGHARPWQGEDGAFAEVRFGATILAAAGGGGMFFDYGARIGRDGETFGAGFGWTGRYSLGSEGNILESTIDQLTLDLSLQRGPVRPTLAVRVPFDGSLNEYLDYAVIVGVRVPLK